MDARGDAVAVWLDGGRTMALHRPAGGTWSSAIRLSAPGGGIHFPQVAISPHGTTFVVWERVMGVHERIQIVRRPVAGAWSTVRTLSGTFGDANYPQVAVAQGAATVAWERDWADGGRSAIFVVRRSASGQWSSPRQVSPEGHPGNSPSVAMNARGDTVVAWEGRQSGIPTVQAVEPRRSRGAGGTGRTTGSWRPGGRQQAPGGRRSRCRPRVRTRRGLTSPSRPASPPSPGKGRPSRECGGRSAAPGAVIPLSHGAAGSSHQLAVYAGGHTVVAWKHFDGSHDRVLVTSRD
ncbi:MAG: hypothetical protein WAV00_10470 [Nocardioides sp.]